MYACLAVTCHLHFWQNDRDFLRATVVTRGWNGYRNKSQHRKSTLEKKILPPFQQGFEPATFQSRVRCSNHWAIPAPKFVDWLEKGFIYVRDFEVCLQSSIVLRWLHAVYRTLNPVTKELTRPLSLLHCPEPGQNTFWDISRSAQKHTVYPCCASGFTQGLSTCVPAMRASPQSWIGPRLLLPTLTLCNFRRCACLAEVIFYTPFIACLWICVCNLSLTFPIRCYLTCNLLRPPHPNPPPPSPDILLGMMTMW